MTLQKQFSVSLKLMIMSGHFILFKPKDLQICFLLSNFFSSGMKLFYYFGLQVQFIETITQLLGVLSIFMAHEFSFMACQHDVCPRQKTPSNTMSKKALQCQLYLHLCLKKFIQGFLRNISQIFQYSSYTGIIKSSNRYFEFNK